MSPRLAQLMLLLTLGFVLASLTEVHAQTTAFNYQGRLQDNGVNANGNYDFQFTLWDALSSGTQQPQPTPVTVSKNAVAVSNGVFTVQLDFGASAFPGADRWLETSVRLAGSGTFTTLSPRQSLTSTPYAVRSLSAASADVVSVSGIPAGNGSYIQNRTSQQAASDFNISGNGTAGGTLSGNVVNAATQYNLGGQHILSRTSTGDIFVRTLVGHPNFAYNTNNFFGDYSGSDNTIGFGNNFFGVFSGQSNTEGAENAFFGTFSGSGNSTGDSNAFFGAQSGRANVTGSYNTAIGSNASFGFANLTNATAIGANARVDQSDSLVLGRIGGDTFAGVNVGIGTTTPAHRLSVIGGPPWTSNGWLGSVELSNQAAIGWRANSGGKHFGIGHTNGGLYLFTTSSTPGTSNTPAFYQLVITDDGSVGIGTSTPARMLEVAGNIRVANCVEDHNGTSITGTSCSSDIRFKRDITPFPNLLNRVVKLQPVNYYWRTTEFPEKRFGTQQSYGLIAQEVERVLPELVGEDKEGFKTVDYSKLPLMMLQAIKEQQTQIEQQQKQLKQQKELIERERAANAAQQQQLNALKNLLCRSHRRAQVCK